MKKSFILGSIVIAGSVFGCCRKAVSDSVSDAKAANAKKTYKNSLKEHESDFLIKVADGRIMGKLEGEEAMKKGTTDRIREYGSLMVKDQPALLVKVRQLADERGYVLPSEISQAKKDGLKDLSEKQGTDFDDKFIKMMIIDHERDVEYFKDAIKLKDKEISTFASSNLPIIESHLAKLKAIRDHH